MAEWKRIEIAACAGWGPSGIARTVPRLPIKETPMRTANPFHRILFPWHTSRLTFAILLIAVLLAVPIPAARAGVGGVEAGTGTGQIQFGSSWQSSGCSASGLAQATGTGFTSHIVSESKLFSLQTSSVKMADTSLWSGGGTLSLCGNVQGSCLGVAGSNGRGKLEYSGDGVTTYAISNLGWNNPSTGVNGSLWHMVGDYQAFRDGVSQGTGTITIDAVGVGVLARICSAPEQHTPIGHWSSSTLEFTIQLIRH